jgi:hypothetical protein
MDHVDVLHALREPGRVEVSLGDFESNTMDRLRNGQVKLDPPHAYECARERIGALMGVSRVEE